MKWTEVLKCSKNAAHWSKDSGTICGLGNRNAWFPTWCRSQEGKKAFNFQCNWNLTRFVFQLWISVSLPGLCVWLSNLPLSVYFSVCEFFCLVKHMFYVCGVICKAFVLCVSGSECTRLYPIRSCCLFACFCLERLPDQVCVLFPLQSVVYILCPHLWTSLFLLLSVFDIPCPYSICIVYISACLPDHFTVSLQWVSLGYCSDSTCFCFNIYPCVYLLFLSFFTSGYGVCVSSLLVVPVCVGITKCVFRCVYFSVYVSLLSVLGGYEADKRSSHDMYPLSDPVCQWKDLWKLSSPLQPPHKATANIFHRDALIFIFPIFPPTFCWHWSFTLRISALWSKCL